MLSSCSNSNLPTAENDGILVTGSATIQSSPDLATLRVGVQSFDKNVEKAVNDNNTKIESIILNLGNKGLTEKDMKPINSIFHHKESTEIITPLSSLDIM